MQRSALTRMSSAWALAAYLGFVLFAAPCGCLAMPAEASEAAVCCCGPDAANPCAPKTGGQQDAGCEGVLGAGCAQALPEASATDLVSEELNAPAPAFVLSFELPSPEAALAQRSRARTPSPPALALAQVRSTVLLI